MCRYGPAHERSQSSGHSASRRATRPDLPDRDRTRAVSARIPPRVSAPAPPLVVGIGASAGGLQAFREFLSVLPPDSGAAFLLVQHLDPNHESLLSELIAPHTAMEVRDAEQDEPLCADTVYVIRPGNALAVRDGRIELSEPTLHRGIRLPVDHLFRSLAREYGNRAVGIVLSGAGSDGSSGLRDLKGAGGLTIAQKPASSGQPGMPNSAIDTGLIDLVLEISDMPEALERFASLPPDARVDPQAEESGELPQARGDEEAEAGDGDGGGPDGDPDGAARHLEESDLTRLKALLVAQIDFDLGIYKRGTIERRVLRRMLLSGFEQVSDYVDHLRERPVEQQTLVRDLLISVTDFFRDVEAHRALHESVVEPLIAGLGSDGGVRAWVAGCATGEEAYSLGMTLLDAAAEGGKTVDVQIFATDVDHEALAFARVGVYPPSIVDRIPKERLERYFHPFDGRGYRVRSALRNCISFVTHDLTRDPPFSRMDIVSCRNVLIYLSPDTQRHVLALMHFALREEACLMLGTSESPSVQPGLFTTLSKSARLYRKSGLSRPPSMSYGSGKRRSDGQRDRSPRKPPAGGGHPAPPRTGAADPARGAVLEAWAPPTLIVAGDGSVVFMHGELGPFLQFPQGEAPRLSLDAMLRQEFAMRTRGALYRCRRTAQPVTVVTSGEGGPSHRVRISARPAATLGDGAVMLSFETLERDRKETGEAIEDAPRTGEGVEDEAAVEQLEYELRATREDLRSTVEELETSNEELRSSNEESMSMNEELQAANEELESTTEELRSLNEELTTVNGQLREKIEQLEQVNDDLGNFFASARVAMLFLDEQLRMKRFTPAAAELLSIDPSDVGRFTGDFSRELLQMELEQEAQHVLEHLEPHSRELRTRDGRWFVRRVLPYRTESRRIEGVVVTLFDITERRRATERLAARERQQSVIARLGLEGLAEPDLQSLMNRAVEEVQATLELDYCKILELQPGGERLLIRAGGGWREGLVGSGYVGSGTDSQAGYTLQSAEPVIVDDLASETRFSGPSLLVEHEVTSGVSCPIRAGTEVYGVIGGHTRERRHFTQEDADFVQAVANIVGSASEHYQTRLRTRLEHEVSRLLIAHTDPEDTLAAVQNCLCTELGAVASEVWLYSDEDAAELACRRVHTALGAIRQETLEKLCGRDVRHAEDPVALVLASGEAVGLTDLGTPELLAHDARARSLGYRTAFAFPLQSGERLLGVMTLYAAGRLFTNAPFLLSLESVGRTVGDKLARIAHERRAAWLAAITESTQDALFSHDARGRVTEWLSGAERLLGYKAEKMIGTSIERIVPEERRAEVRSVTRRVLAGMRLEPFESVRLASDGRQIEVSVRNSPIRDPHGNVVGVSSIERGIERQKETERRLRMADKQKDEFLAMLGHELRNPLASIRTAAELLGMGVDESETRHARTVIERQSDHMARLLDGLLDVSRIVSGKITLDSAVVDFADVCRSVLEDSAGSARRSEIALRVELPEAALPVNADRVRLAQVVDNLLSNAIHYTPSGGSVTLALALEGSEAVLRVCDDGVGIEEELLPYVFDVFRQSERHLDRAEGGLGLGLALVRSIVALHGGIAEAYSDGPGKGAEFVVRLPVSKVPPGRAGRRGRAPGAALDILLIEDNPDSADVTTRVLKRLGHRVSSTARGREGVEMAAREVPDIVLCDLGLPDNFSGYDVVRELRGREETRAIRTVALSGYGRAEDKAKSREAGFDDHLTKPVSIAMLKGILKQDEERIL